MSKTRIEITQPTLYGAIGEQEGQPKLTTKLLIDVFGTPAASIVATVIPEQNDAAAPAQAAPAQAAPAAAVPATPTEAAQELYAAAPGGVPAYAAALPPFRAVLEDRDYGNENDGDDCEKPSCTRAVGGAALGAGAGGLWGLAILPCCCPCIPAIPAAPCLGASAGAGFLAGLCSKNDRGPRP